MKLQEIKLNSKTVYDGKILRLELDEVELPDGKTSKRECVRHSGGAAVLLVKDEQILLVKQFRYLYGKPIYEIPAGKLNNGEDAMVAAARELEEETGFKAELSHLLDIFPSPGYTDEIIHIYIAEKFEITAQNLDDNEFLNYCFIDVNAVLAMIESGEICDSKTIVAVYKYLLIKNELCN